MRGSRSPDDSHALQHELLQHDLNIHPCGLHPDRQRAVGYTVARGKLVEVAKGRGPGGSSSLSRPSPGVTGQGVPVRVWQVLSVVTGPLVGPGKAGPLSSNPREGRNNQQGVRLANVSDVSSDALSDVSSSDSTSSNVFPVASTKRDKGDTGG